MWLFNIAEKLQQTTRQNMSELRTRPGLNATFCDIPSSQSEHLHEGVRHFPLHY